MESAGTQPRREARYPTARRGRARRTALRCRGVESGRYDARPDRCVHVSTTTATGVCTRVHTCCVYVCVWCGGGAVAGTVRAVGRSVTSEVVTVPKHDTVAKARVPSSLYEKAQALDTPVSDLIRTGLKMGVYGEEVVAAEAKNEVDREQCEATEAGINKLISAFEQRDAKAFTRTEVVDALESLRDERVTAVDQRIQERQQQSQTAVETRQEEELDDALATLEMETVRHPNGRRVFPDYPPVRDVASEFGVTPNEIIETLRERNPDVPSHAFKAGGNAVTKWHGLSEERADTPVEEREPRDERQSDAQSAAATDGGERR